ncbi:MAG: adenylate/guanylate cyclase domain-containing protein [Phycisphaerae bacterium]|nr:adenylate/guanylate cyclase domain-containing protein [Tepidisphaeraceae bacterium]
MPNANLMVSVGIVAALLLTIGGLVWYLKRRRARLPGVCGKCGYNVTGIPTFTCPECGSDLREVGIVQGTGGRIKPSREAVALGVQLGAWTLLYAALYGFLGAHSYPKDQAALEKRKIEYGLIDAYWWPYDGRSKHEVVLKSGSTGFETVTVTERRQASFRGWRHAPVVNWTGNAPPVALDELEITLEIEPYIDPNTPRVATTPLKIDARNLANVTWAYEDPTTAGKFLSGSGPLPPPATAPTTAPAANAPVPLDADLINQWIRHNGVMIASNRVRDEAEALYQLILETIKPQQVTSRVPTTGRLEAIVAGQRANWIALTGDMQGYPFGASRGVAQDQYGPAWSIYWLSIPFGLGVYTYGANWIWARHRKVKRRKRREAAAAAPPSKLLGDRQQSKTLTILFTDLKDYTARTSASPRGELLDMLKANQQIVEVAVRRNRGKIMKTIGDAYLVTFESATDALLAGLQIQQGAVDYNRDAPADRRLEYRVAVCTGEVLFTGGDVFGTPVNMAARVQAVAEPGEVYFTESTFHAINSPDVGTEEVGERELKGIPGAVRLFKAVGKERG